MSRCAGIARATALKCWFSVAVGAVACFADVGGGGVIIDVAVAMPKLCGRKIAGATPSDVT